MEDRLLYFDSIIICFLLYYIDISETMMMMVMVLSIKMPSSLCVCEDEDVGSMMLLTFHARKANSIEKWMHPDPLFLSFSSAFPFH